MNKTWVWLVIGSIAMTGMVALCYAGKMPSEAVAGAATLAIKGFVDAMGKGERHVDSPQV